MVQALHHGVVDRVRRAQEELPRRGPEELPLLLALGHGRNAHLVDGRMQCLDRLHPDRGAHHEDAAVPPVVATGHVLRGKLDRRLLDEALHMTHAVGQQLAKLDVAIARVRPGGRHAKGDDGPLVGMRGRDRQRPVKGAGIGNRVVGRHDHQDCVLAAGQRQRCGQRERGRRIAPGRFHHQPALHAAGLQLFAGDEAMLVAADDDGVGLDLVTGGEALHAQQRGLQQRVLADQVDQLLGEMFSRQRPQPRAGAAGQHHGRNAQARGRARRHRNGVPGLHGNRLQHLLRHDPALPGRAPRSRSCKRPVAPIVYAGQCADLRTRCRSRMPFMPRMSVTPPR